MSTAYLALSSSSSSRQDLINRWEVMNFGRRQKLNSLELLIITESHGKLTKETVLFMGQRLISCCMMLSKDQLSAEQSNLTFSCQSVSTFNTIARAMHKSAHQNLKPRNFHQMNTRVKSSCGRKKS